MSTTFQIMFRLPGKNWKRKSFKTEAALERFVEALDDDAEVRYCEEN